jgi:hypothetical protein
MQDAMDGQFIPGERGERDERDERILADAITTLSEAMRSRLELVDRSEHMALSALTALSELLTERLEALDRNQQLLLEAVGDLQWRIELSPRAVMANDVAATRALQAEMNDALRWTRPDTEPPPFVIQLTR